MNKWILFCLVNFMFGLSVSFANTAAIATNNTQKIIVTSSIPKGVVVKKNKITLKSGYTFNRISASSVSVMAKKRKDGTSGPISGEFTCGCQTNGSCKLIIDGTSIWCSVDTCGSSCQMTVSIPSSVNVIH